MVRLAHYIFMLLMLHIHATHAPTWDGRSISASSQARTTALSNALPPNEVGNWFFLRQFTSEKPSQI